MTEVSKREERGARPVDSVFVADDPLVSVQRDDRLAAHGAREFLPQLGLWARDRECVCASAKKDRKWAWRGGAAGARACSIVSSGSCMAAEGVAEADAATDAQPPLALPPSARSPPASAGACSRCAGAACAACAFAVSCSEPRISCTSFSAESTCGSR